MSSTFSSESSPLDTFIRPEESEAAFRRFEPVISEFIRAYRKGQGYLASTRTLASTTYAVRLRDAIRGMLKHQYPSTLVDPSALAEAWQGSIVTARSTNHVYIGPKVSVPMPVEKAYEQRFTEVNLCANHVAFVHIVRLAELNILSPFKITCLPTDKEYFESYTRDYDVALQWENDTTCLLS